MQVLFGLYFQLDTYLNDVWLGVDPSTYDIIKHMFKGKWTTTSNRINYSSLLNTEHKSSDLCIHLKRK